MKADNQIQPPSLARDQAADVASPLQALHELQKSLNARLSRRQIENWATETRCERMKSSARRQ
jgi:hypothetical protein